MMHVTTKIKIKLLCCLTVHHWYK